MKEAEEEELSFEASLPVHNTQAWKSPCEG